MHLFREAGGVDGESIVHEGSGDPPNGCSEYAAPKNTRLQYGRHHGLVGLWIRFFLF